MDLELLIELTKNLAKFSLEIEFKSKNHQFPLYCPIFPNIELFPKDD